MKKAVFFLFLVSLLLGFVTRFYKLGEAPAGLYLDEAAQGYNAYSILLTGKDEFGMPYPVVFRSFNDFKTPVYIYLVVPLIKIFDLTKFTVRFPSLLFSMLSFPILFLIIYELSPKKYKIPLSLVSILLLSISPWHILFGRTNFECNVALFFFLTGVLMFYKSLKRPKLLLIAALSFAIAIPAYHSQRVITPLTMLFLFARYRFSLLQKFHRPYLMGGLLIGFIILIPTLFVSTTPGFLARASGLNIFSHSRQLPPGYVFDYSGVWQTFINSSIFLSTREFLSLYTSYLSPREMFVLGDYGPRSSFPYLSTFFIWQFPFYIAGIYWLIRKTHLGEIRSLMLALLLISPIPAAVTRDPYSSIRALPLVIPQIIIISLAIVELWFFLSKRSSKFIFIGSFALLVSYSLVKLYSSIIVLNEYYRANEWNYGWQQVVETINTLPSQPIVVDNTRSEPYSQLLFFLKFDPTIYQNENFEVPLNEYYTNMNRNTTKKIGTITTRPISWEQDLKDRKYLIGDSSAISDDQVDRHKLKVVKDIYFPDGSIAFRIVETSP